MQVLMFQSMLKSLSMISVSICILKGQCWFHITIYHCISYHWVSLYQIKELFEKTISNSSLNSHVWDTLLFTHIAPTQNTAGAPIRLQRCRAQKLRVCGKNSVPFQATGYLLYKSIKCTKRIAKMLSLFIQKPT